MSSAPNPEGKGGFVKGQSGNPGGRPRDLKDVQALARVHTADCINALVDIVKNKKAQPSARAMASTALLDRGYGKPTQTVNANLSILDKLSLHEQRALETALACLGGAGAEADTDTDETTH